MIPYQTPCLKPCSKWGPSIQKASKNYVPAASFEDRKCCALYFVGPPKADVYALLLKKNPLSAGVFTPHDEGLSFFAPAVIP